jgi:DNA-binding FrmR family transcriptional regulator
MKLDPVEVKPSITRLKRARGQIDAVIRMLEEGDECDKAVTQLAAAAKAIDRAGYSIIATGMKACYAESGPEGIDAEKMEKLFLSLS